jgi:phospholipid/cholesterol/gamma-HCH transport system permease protein
MSEPGKIDFSRPSADILHGALSGSWKIGTSPPSDREVVHQLEDTPQMKSLVIDATNITGWDSTLLTFLITAKEACQSRNIGFEHQGLPAGAQRLLNIASAVPEQKDARPVQKCNSFFYMVGNSTVEFGRSTLEMLAFIGDAPGTCCYTLRRAAPRPCPLSP